MSNKRNVFWLPIEPLEERYTKQMHQWVLAGIPDEVNTVTVMPEYEGGINHGQWLDTFASQAYRAKQIQIVCELFATGKVKDNDIFLVGDIWMPSVESIKYMSELSGIKVKMCGWHFAGCFDKEDLLSRTLSSWGKKFENMIVEDIFDCICCGSTFHKMFLSIGVPMCGEKLFAYGLPWSSESVKNMVSATTEKKKIVIFPHRSAPEKQPEVFCKVAEILKPKYPEWKFVFSTNNERTVFPESSSTEVVVHKTKQSYYEYLSQCSIYFSAGKQETFGYSLHESIALGCSVVAPSRCSYGQMLKTDKRFVYKSDDDCVKLLEERMNNFIPVPYEYTEAWSNNSKKFIEECLKC